MKNKKGFVLTETLVVTVFLVTISTFIYVSIVPLMGRYEDLVNREKSIDIVYKLNNIRQLLIDDDNKDTITNGNYNNNVTCDQFARSTYCTKLMQQMELTNFRLIYVNNIYNNIGIIRGVDTELNITDLYQYIKAYIDDEGSYLILVDLKTHTVAHLLFSPFVQTY